jgi:putative endonuclease
MEAPAAYGSPMVDAWVYMLRCRDGSLYTGWSTDVQRRLARHQAGKASRYTASRRPLQLELALPMADRGRKARPDRRSPGAGEVGRRATGPGLRAR